jgi:hypothetical protein
VNKKLITKIDGCKRINIGTNGTSTGMSTPFTGCHNGHLLDSCVRVHMLGELPTFEALKFSKENTNDKKLELNIIGF